MGAGTAGVRGRPQEIEREDPRGDPDGLAGRARLVAAFKDPAPADSRFDRLRAANREAWDAYVAHAFVRQLGAGTLPEPAFKFYLIQDYLFLVQFARAYALAAYKSDTLDDMRQAARSMRIIVDDEMSLHVKFCAGWGLGLEDMLRVPEAPQCMAYTRFVLEAGHAGDILDLQAALAPCVVGYAEIANRLMADPATRLDGNPYRAWIEAYAGSDYQGVAAAAVAQLDRLYARRAGQGRDAALARLFGAATRLEADFWQMGLDAA
ncbi:MAG: thiaminase II [Alphaproteobacteria bacterium]|nr:thiaminase II [Alphaproteobacteria bacterium]